MQRITKASEVLPNEWYWVGERIIKTYKKGRWLYFKESCWVCGETVQSVLAHSRLFGPVYGPIPKPPQETSK